MKKLALVLTFICLFAGNELFAQQKNVAKINLLSLPVLTFSGFYERAVSDKMSVQLGLFQTFITTAGTKFRGFGITPEFRYYVTGEALNGFYVGPFLRYQRFTLTAKDIPDEKGTLSAFGGGLLIGRQWILGKGFVVDVFGGPSYSVGEVKTESGSGDNFSSGAFTGPGVRVGVAIGFAF